MALREFNDREGAAWRVWDITPETTHPATRIEDYLQGFIDGWLVFEKVDGGEKRRLYPLPARWYDASDEQLERMCMGADPVRPPPGGTRRDAPPARDVGVRTFTYPGGRVWTVTETPVQYRDQQGAPLDSGTVLRFASGSRALDLLAWPRDWMQRSEEDLAELLWQAFPRAAVAEGQVPERRRRGEGGSERHDAR
ncbi:MAG TPA: hypothetical protein VMM18_05885 [Gemmatimonadaceae bacterium]|nr:hypothetical protein [Gemmatimonadaceae bacterium]